MSKMDRPPDGRTKTGQVWWYSVDGSRVFGPMPMMPLSTGTRTPPNPPSTIPQADDGGRLDRLRRRNAERMREWHDVHHADPTHSCAFKTRCRLCDEEGRR